MEEFSWRSEKIEIRSGCRYSSKILFCLCDKRFLYKKFSSIIEMISSMENIFIAFLWMEFFALFAFSLLIFSPLVAAVIFFLPYQT